MNCSLNRKKGEQEAVDINEGSGMPDIYSELHQHEYLSLYTKLNNLFADQYNVALCVHMADIILTKE